MWGNIAIGVRCYDKPESDHYVSMVRFLGRGLRDGDVALDPVVRWCSVISLRKVLTRFLETACDSLLILEDDIVFAPEDADALRESGEGYGILSALFPARRYPFNPQVFRTVRRDTNSVDDLVGVIDVEAVPFGFCLIRRAVVEGVRARVGEHRMSRWGAVDECITFCEDARILGHKIGMNTGVSVGHQIRGVKAYCNATTGAAEVRWDNE